MRVLVIVKANAAYEAGQLPSEQLLNEMGKYNADLVEAGILLAGEGLHPSSKGKRVRALGAQRSVVDGPFSETKELVSGFWIWQVASMDDALEWAKRVPTPEGEEMVLELRPLFETAEYGDAMTPEQQAQEEKLRVAVAERAKP